MTNSKTMLVVGKYIVSQPQNQMVKWEHEEQGKRVVLYPCQREAPVVVFSSSLYLGLLTLQSYGHDLLPV